MGRRKSAENEKLPPKMLARKKRGGTYYYFNFTDENGQRSELPLGPILSAALTRHAELYVNQGIRKPDRSYAKHLMARVRANAKARGIRIDITEADIVEMLERSQYACELTGIPFDIAKNKNYRVRPWAPSVDRIDSFQAYTFDNCRVVCAAVNSAMNQYGEELLLLIARKLISSKKKKLRTDLRTEDIS